MNAIAHQRTVLSALTGFFIIMYLSCNHLKADILDNSKTDLEEVGLKGNVKSVTEVAYTVAFNPVGNVTKGEAISVLTTLYNSDGNIVETCYDTNYGDFVFSKKSVYKYDDKGKRIEIAKYDFDELESKETFEYDDRGNTVKICIYNATGELEIESVYDYDGRNNMIEYRQQYGGVGLHWFFKYDENNNRIERRWDYPDGRLRGRITFKYDERGNMIEQRAYGDGLVSTINTGYDEYGNVIEYRAVTSVDDSFNVFEQHEYQFDAHVNWIERITYMKQADSRTVQAITERKIDYY